MTSDSAVWVHLPAINPITIDPEIMGGTPCFEGTRVPVENLDDFLEQFPRVTREQAVTVLEMAKQQLTAPQAQRAAASKAAPAA